MAEYMIDGYEFKSKGQYQRALKEKELVEKIKKGLGAEDIVGNLATYNKIIGKNYFATPIGISFLYELRSRLVEETGDDNIRPVPVVMLKASGDARLKKELDKSRVTRQKLIVAVVSLAIAIIGIIIIISTNDNIGYINTEEKILNKYSAWQEQLDERERQLDEREAELSEREAQNR